ncbi:transglutaminase domain-containing protein [Mycolicibacterium sp. 141076]|jgi:transglutaminase-like putative cysteine protease|uniref:transglutaminase-like domain-containing protein n=2 Tax=Mycobacteriaceae TaxID=1762 RepID=UPI0009275443|nr:MULTISPECIES: transglutaminase domain-containing protein [Mycolicibacterium]MDX1881108.1 transglutaminase domain-containing protein [Mycolicibacterium sp. 141076]RUP28154.1 MAG: transglutaminase [Mycolicibacterium sp.]UCZ58896.1 transglutaminase domain-containing protein [Mycolicibacterium phocaicum]SHT76788.1 Transglutaminase-like superfamily [Mycobacteroides abscessus subsp. abscessus]
MTDDYRRYLETTEFLDWQHDAVRDFVSSAIRGASDDITKAICIFTAVRDSIWYDPYTVTDNRDAYRASTVATSGRAYCVPKAVLLTAACRAAGIPARLGFADVRNHLQTKTLRERMGGTDVFVYHGYSLMFLNGAWVKATPAFNRELCARFGVSPIDFDGRSDALLHGFTGDGTQHMEYLCDRGAYDDLPLADILQALKSHYGSFIDQPNSSPDLFA